LKVWIDYDISYGQIANEIDDGYALIHAILAERHLKSIEIVGVSSVHGNTADMKFQMSATFKIFNQLGRQNLNFYTGANSAAQLGQMTAAVGGLISALEKYPVKILALGRLTNIATVFMLRPDLITNLDELVIMGGRQYEKKSHFGAKQIEFPDLNIDGDPLAMREVYARKIPITLISSHVMLDRLINKNHLKKMLRSNRLTASMAKKAALWSWIWRFLLGSHNGFIPWDVFLISYLTHPHAFAFEFGIPYEVRLMENSTHHLYSRKYRTKEKDFLVTSRTFEKKALAKLCVHIHPSHVDELVDFWCGTPDIVR
jgi:inosine-uridine nucleoside N-ribohydrolase